MKLKRLFQILVLFALLFSLVGSSQPVHAGTNSIDPPDIVQEQPTVSMTLSPSSVHPGELALVTVNLNNVPDEGYSSVEVTCTFDPARVEASNIVVGNLFGIDPVVAINGPHDDRFIVAVAGSGGQSATEDGAVIAFNLRGLLPGETILHCRARVSWPNQGFINIYAIPSTLTVLGGILTPTLEPAPCDQAQFYADINVPPGTVMAPGETFMKVWRLVNVGSCSWTTSYKLVFFSGEQMGAPAEFPLNVDVVPGQIVDVAIFLTAPSAPGSYRGNWMFMNGNGALFGVGSQGNQPWFVDIVVPSPSVTSTPAQTDTPTVTPSITPGGSTVTPSLTPGGLTPTPLPNTVFDFVALASTATWSSGAGPMPYPGIDGDPRGFAFRVNHPRLETGATNTRPGLLTFPQSVQNGFIQGVYPSFHVQTGDRFHAILGCEGGATLCYGAFRLDYQIGGDPIRTVWGPFLERYDGKYYTANVDLSPLAGKDVKFILTVLSAGVATGDRMLWVNPVITREGAVGPSATPSGEEPTSTPSVTPVFEPTWTPSATVTETPTVTPVPQGFINGKVQAGKPVMLDVYDENNTLLFSWDVSEEGLFGIGMDPGSYTLVVRASGYLSARTSVDVTLSGVYLPTISLPAGDIDGNHVIDAYDALTIGMNYNTAGPSAADLNDDGIINVLDLELLARNYRRTGPVPWLG